MENTNEAEWSSAAQEVLIMSRFGWVANLESLELELHDNLEFILASLLR
jgi:hypothetical protein